MELGDASADAIDPEIRLRQVKEKFGMLRIYVEYGAPEKVYRILNDAERESGTICDQCGRPRKQVRLLAYVCTRCEEHGKWLKLLPSENL